MKYVTCFLACLVSAVGQTLLPSPRPLLETLSLVVPPRATPGVLVIHGARGAKDQASEVRIALDETKLGRLSRFLTAPGRYVTSLPISEAGQDRVLRLDPAPAGMVVGPVEVVEAARLDIEVLAEDTREPVPAVVEVAAADGHELPLYGFLPESLHAGPAVLLPEGKGTVLLPPGGAARLVAYSHPFRKIQRRSVQARANSRAGVRFLLGPDLLPEGATILEGPRPELLDYDAGKALDSVLGIQRRVNNLPALPADVVADGAEAFLSRLADAEAPSPVLTAATGPCGLPGIPRPLRTVHFKDGGVLHSNGPVILASLRREGGLDLDLRFADDVRPRRFSAFGPEGRILEVPVTGPGPIPLAPPLPRGSRIVTWFEGDAFIGDLPAGPRPMAFRVVMLP